MTSIRTLSIVLASVALLAGAACTSTRTQKSAGETVDDAVLTTRVKAALIGEPMTRARNIDLEVFKGRVQLNGFVESSAEKSRAAAVARGVEGVTSVKNNLTVRAGSRSAGTVIDDATLAAQVKAALMESAETKAYQVEVNTQDGVVQLGGFVNSAAAKSAAGAIARGIAGVKSVDNQISVK